MRKHLAMVGILGVALVALAAEQAGKTFKPDDEGFIRNWVILEPIPLGETANTHEEDTQKPMFNKQYFDGQKDGTPQDGDKVKVDSKDLAWHAHSASDYAIDFEKIAADASKEPTNALFFGVAYIIAADQKDGVKLAIGSDDSSVWWLNGNEVIRVYSGRGVDKDQDTAENLTLKKGLNVLRFAVINGDGPTGACARFMDKGGSPVKEITILSSPPKKE
ncbi:MAG TPA: hypothetical protein VGQ99_04950 [Tepidisphaeraceae bacterium]|nr:hypothetical protein [Tepidisphaeraceae bacterium]